MSRRAPKEWSHGLCDCCEDASLSCSVCLCECNAAGQMYERTTKRGCLLISSVLWITFLVSQSMSDTATALAATAEREVCAWWGACITVVDWDQVTASQVVGAIAGGVGMITAVLGTYAVCVSRRRIRERDGIPGDDCDDCCSSFWCGCCSLVQMLRQDKITGTTYRPCSATAV